MPISIEEFNTEFYQDIQGEAYAGGTYAEDAFVELFCDSLVDAGELETYDRTPYVAPQGGVRIDAYGGDPIETDGILNLVIADFNPTPELRTLTNTDMESIYKRAQNFVTRSLEEKFRSGIDESAPAFGLADMIAVRWDQLTKIRLILVSNRILSARVDGRDEGKLADVPVTFSVWDLGRLHRLAISGQGREEIEIDLIEEFGRGLSALPAHLPNAGYESYLVVVPGAQLAKIYDRWGTRLLEQNVRVFLQARGNVNKGIRNTIDQTPEMFFAYNNGITATAEGICTDNTSTGMLITRLKNLQIVNGGQTTASIHAASMRKDADISNVFVQMKLSIVAPEDTLEVVPKISEYANSQNRVSAADFFSNHPFHVRMEEFSRRIFAPSKDGTFRESKWFYERARGQYQDARGNLTQGQRKKFDAEYPRRQVFSKTDLAKFHNVWRELPHVVSKGAQKNFADFAQHIGTAWSRNADEFNERFFRTTIARAIIFRETEKVVSSQDWYEGGYRANIVAYAIARMSFEISLRKSHIDFDRIWSTQTISPAMRSALAISAKVAHDVIMNPPAGTRNISEWAKQQGCWARISKQPVDWPNEFLQELITTEEQLMERTHAVKEQRVLNGIQAQSAVVNAGPELWKSVLDWGNRKRLLSTRELGCLRVAANIPNRIPTEKQSVRILEALKRLHVEGFELGKDIATTFASQPPRR